MVSLGRWGGVGRGETEVFCGVGVFCAHCTQEVNGALCAARHHTIRTGEPITESVDGEGP